MYREPAHNNSKKIITMKSLTEMKKGLLSFNYNNRFNGQSR